MCKASGNQSALFIATGDDDDDVNVLVVGGGGGTGKEAALLTNHQHEACGNRVSQWRWQQLNPMLEERPNSPRLLLLGGERVLVCGGLLHRWSFLFGHSSEIINLPAEKRNRNYADAPGKISGHWLSITFFQTNIQGNPVLENREPFSIAVTTFQ